MGDLEAVVEKKEVNNIFGCGNYNTGGISK